MNSFIGDINRDIRTRLSSENILFCPGNHDFAFSKEAPGIIPLTKDSSINFFDFYKKIHNIAPNKYFASGRKFVLSNGITVEIVALNSLTLQQFSTFEGQGFLSDEQLSYVASGMGWRSEEKTGTIRIAMMHHHYLPTYVQDTLEVGRASSVVYDAERLIRWMKNYNIKVLLHGHKHVRFYSQVSHPINMDEEKLEFASLFNINVVGMGSTGSREIPEGQSNMFATITFEPSHIYFDFYRLDSQSSAKKIQRIELTNF